MSDTPNTPNKKPKFSPYWIYGSILVFFLLFQFFGTGGLQEENNISQSQFFQYMQAGDVEKIDIVRNSPHVIKVYLTEEAEAKEVHKKSKPKSIFPTTARIPNYKFKYGDLQNFENQFAAVKSQSDLSTELVYSEENNTWTD